MQASAAGGGNKFRERVRAGSKLASTRSDWSENMKKKLRTRKPGQKLLPQWSEEENFAVKVTVRPRTEPRFLKNYTISIHVRKPGLQPAPSRLGAVE